MPPINPRHARHLELLQAWAQLLDNRFRIPGIGFRFGLDPIIGLIPFLGDVATPLFGAAIVLQAFRMGIPKVIQARMLINVIIDVAVGAIPFLGDLFDFVWKSNAMNLVLLEDHAYEVRRPSRGDYVFVIGAFAVLAACVIVPFLALVWLIHAIESLRFL